MVKKKKNLHREGNGNSLQYFPWRTLWTEESVGYSLWGWQSRSWWTLSQIQQWTQILSQDNTHIETSNMNFLDTQELFWWSFQVMNLKWSVLAPNTRWTENHFRIYIIFLLKNGYWNHKQNNRISLKQCCIYNLQ